MWPRLVGAALIALSAIVAGALLRRVRRRIVPGRRRLPALAVVLALRGLLLRSVPPVVGLAVIVVAAVVAVVHAMVVVAVVRRRDDHGGGLRVADATAVGIAGRMVILPEVLGAAALNIRRPCAAARLAARRRQHGLNGAVAVRLALVVAVARSDGAVVVALMLVGLAGRRQDLGLHRPLLVRLA